MFLFNILGKPSDLKTFHRLYVDTVVAMFTRDNIG